MNPLKDTKDQLTSDSLNPTSSTSQHRRFVAEHNTCAMCDTKLEIRHEINMNDLKVKEEAHCPCCGIRVRSSHHLMH